jgi:sec-independent protein translocase protein TatA
MGALRPWHVIVVVLIFLLLFGAKRLPELSRSLGRSLRILKAETKGLMDDDVVGKAEPKSGRQPLTVSDDDIMSPDPLQQSRDK